VDNPEKDKAHSFMENAEKWASKVQAENKGENMAEAILGIDFGTTNSVMAAIDQKTGQPQVIPNAEGEEKTPSIVYYAPEGVIVGRGAESALSDAEFLEGEERDMVLQSIFRSVKRELGNKQMHALPDGKTVTPAEIASEVIRKLKKDAEELYFHEPLTRAVITHPAAFSPSQRKAVEEAAHLAGFESVTLLEEPVAAALGQMARGEKVGAGMLVYDLGGGTFDLAYVQRDGETGFRTPLGPLGMVRCGGDDVDQKIYDYIDELARAQGLSLYHRDGNLSQSTLLECRKGKEDLSSRTQTRITVMIPEVHAVPKHYFLKRDELEGLMEEMTARTVKQTLELKRRVEQGSLPLDQVVLIGGSTRSPLIQKKLEEALGGSLPVVKTVYADYAVALGAAMNGIVDTTLIKKSVFAVSAQESLHIEDQSQFAKEKKAQQESKLPVQNEPAVVDLDRMKVQLTSEISMEFVRIPAGEFLMGCNEETDEKPLHKVYLDEYWIGKYPVTEEQYYAFSLECEYLYKGEICKEKYNYPITQVLWKDAKAFCDWATKGMLGRGLIRLPSEAEWEKAARGIDARTYPWGNAWPDSTRCNYDNYRIKDGITPVGSYSPSGDSPYGCCDMAGNVWEWVHDWYYDRYYSKSPFKNPGGPTYGRNRILRGGSAVDWSSKIHCANRYEHTPDISSSYIGFRCALLLNS
jgi:molecular chaperone DnaK (HSP70)